MTMYMTTWKLIALRFFMTTLGRWGWFAEHFKQFMVNYVVVKKKKDRYVASSRYFTLDQLK
ncbi:MAG: hypothetical protein JXR73_08060 [Candidatus Omnitrophica bacterium]|nr:hypothetical protein [Candidatus Omnitrophota bacterium]